MIPTYKLFLFRPALGAPIRGGQVQSIIPGGQLVTHQVRPPTAPAPLPPGSRGPRPATVVPVGVTTTRQLPVSMTAVSFR